MLGGRCFGILPARIVVCTGLGAIGTEEQLTLGLPEEAEEPLEPILEPHGQDPMWYFDKIDLGRQPAPWALACLDTEYAVAGQVVTARRPDSGIRFSLYKQPPPKPTPAEFVPGVGVLVFMSRAGLERSIDDSPLFAAIWSTLRECDPERRWLAVMEPLPRAWLAEVLPGDRERWHAHRRQ